MNEHHASMQKILKPPSETPDTADVRLHGSWFVFARVAGLALVVFDLVVFFASIPGFYTGVSFICPYLTAQQCPGGLTRGNLQAIQHLGLPLNGSIVFFLTLNLILGLLFLVVGVLIFWRKSNELIGLFVSLFFITFGTASINDGRSLSLAVVHPPWGVVLIWQIIEPTIWPALGLFFYIFPNGRFVPRWAWIFMIPWAVQFVAYKVSPDDSPFSPGNWSPLLGLGVLLLTFGSAVGTQIYRYLRFSDLAQRQQTKWVVFGFAITLLLPVLLDIGPALFPALNKPDAVYQLVGETLGSFVFLPIPLTLGIAVLRYRLWDIDILINRTLVYVGLSASVIGLYVLVVMSLGTVFQAQGNLLISLLATGVIAVLFQPLRERLQRGVNRLMFGERDEPYRVLARLGQRLETTLAPETVLPIIVEMVAQALRLPFAAIAWTSGQTLHSSSLVAVYGETSEENLEHIPLVYQTETVGSLMLAPRQRGEQLTPADRRFLSTLASQIAVATHAMRLTVDLKEVNIDLQRSREQLVTTREEERRRLRRDLHDGLGPTLAALNLQMGALRTLIAHDPSAADALAVEWRAHLRKVIADIRSLVYALRPPALDELGLLGALREQINQYRSSGVKLTLNAPEHLPPLPAAVEVACYRIALEALTNVVRHAHAHTCTVHLTIETQLILEVIDDGRGLSPEARRGVGLNSMRERAEELGGTCELSPGSSGGLCVRACLPLSGEMPMNERMKGLRKITLSHF